MVCMGTGIQASSSATIQCLQTTRWQTLLTQVKPKQRSWLNHSTGIPEAAWLRPNSGWHAVSTVRFCPLQTTKTGSFDVFESNGITQCPQVLTMARLPWMAPDLQWKCITGEVIHSGTAPEIEQKVLAKGSIQGVTQSSALKSSSGAS